MSAAGIIKELRRAAEEVEGRVTVNVHIPEGLFWPQAMTVTEAAHYSGISEAAVRRHVKDGTFVEIDTGPLLISRASISKWAGVAE